MEKTAAVAPSNVSATAPTVIPPAPEPLDEDDDFEDFKEESECFF
jgi:hypothetical protein